MTKLATVKALVEGGADVQLANNKGKTPLMWSAQDDLLPALRLLLQNGAHLEARDGIGDTALSWAAENSQDNAVAILMQAGANLENTDAAGTTPLMYAAASGNTKTVALIVHFCTTSPKVLDTIHRWGTHLHNDNQARVQSFRKEFRLGRVVEMN